MGAQIFLKSGTNKAGKAPLFVYAQHRGKKFKKNIGISINPKDWNKRTYQVKTDSISSVKINRKLLELTSTIREAWSLFESEIYSVRSIILLRCYKFILPRKPFLLKHVRGLTCPQYNYFTTRLLMKAYFFPCRHRIISISLLHIAMKILI